MSKTVVFTQQTCVTALHVQGPTNFGNPW